jgi:hypothetical protein
VFGPAFPAVVDGGKQGKTLENMVRKIEIMEIL